MFLFKRPKSKFEFLIAGLGNPGPAYAGTRHNAGFLAADYIADRQKAVFKKKFQSQYCEVCFAGKRGLLQKPTTFMNASGLAVREICAFYGIRPEQVIVVHDDITLEPGHFKIKSGGSDGGHNGLSSIITELKSWDFLHIKLGIGAKPNKEQPLADYVLQKLSDDDRRALESRLPDVWDALELILGGQLEQAKAAYNKT